MKLLSCKRFIISYARSVHFFPHNQKGEGARRGGKRQKWYALRFKGSDSDVRLDKHKPEFDAWRWAKLDEIPGLIVPFKRPVYEDVATRFQRWSEPVDAA